MQDAATHTLAQAQTLAGTAAASAASGVAASSVWEAIGIGPAVLFMALTGTALGLLFTPPGGGRGRLFVLALVYTVVSAGMAVLIAEFAGSKSMQRVSPVIALLLAFSAHTTIPALRDALNSRIKRTVGGDDDNASRIDDGLGPRRGRRTRDDDFDGTWKGD